MQLSNWYIILVFIYIHTLWMWAAKTQANLCYTQIRMSPNFCDKYQILMFKLFLMGLYIVALQNETLFYTISREC